MNKGLQKITFMFWGQLLVLLVLSYFVHVYVYGLFNAEVDLNTLQLAYIINGLLAVFIFTALMFLKKKYNDQLGFLYMLGSFIKFGVYFLVFHPIFKEDGDITKLEFSIFFTPYLLSLIAETIDLIKVLNSPEIP